MQHPLAWLQEKNNNQTYLVRVKKPSLLDYIAQTLYWPENKLVITTITTKLVYYLLEKEGENECGWMNEASGKSLIGFTLIKPL